MLLSRMITATATAGKVLLITHDGLHRKLHSVVTMGSREHNPGLSRVNRVATVAFSLGGDERPEICPLSGLVQSR